MFVLEPGEDNDGERCECCGTESRTGHGFIYKGATPHAVYYVGWVPGHRDQGVTMAIAVGEWDTGSTPAQRTCFGLEVHEGERDVLFRFIDPEESPWGHSELLGSMSRREDALKHPLSKEVLSLAEIIVRGHPSVREFLAAAR